MFIALEVTPKAVTDLQILSPRVMQWDGNIWLIDVELCGAYWQAKAKRCGLGIAELYRRMLREAHGDEHRAVLAEHPWQAILLLLHMNMRDLRGLVHLGEAFGRALYQDVAWQVWWQALKCLGAHFAAVKLRGFKESTFKQQIKLLQRAVERLGASNPWELRAVVGDAAVRRRFGNLLQLVWQWSFPHAHQSFTVFNQRASFPWQNFTFPEEYVVERHLDTPVSEWSHVENLLKTDFDRLCARMDGVEVKKSSNEIYNFNVWNRARPQGAERAELTSQSMSTRSDRERSHGTANKVLVLEWALILSTLSPLRVPIRFRHPHSLHVELHTHGTALLQAYYSFMGKMEEARDHYHDELLTPLPPIMGWRLSVVEMLVLPPRLVDLFGDNHAEVEELIELENRLAVPLEGFDICNDWSVEDSFVAVDQERVRQDNADNVCLASLKSLAIKRPLFIYKRPMSLVRPKGRSSMWRFSERTMMKWWKVWPTTKTNVKRPPLQFDYYRYNNGRGQSLWVSHAGHNEWYVHGIFA